MHTSRRAMTRVIYQRIIKPVLFQVSPDTVHSALLRLALSLNHLPGLQRIGAWWFGAGTLKGKKTVAGLTFRNPIGIAAGLDKNGELLQVASMIGCGFTTVGSVTLRPRKGNPKPWFFRLPRTRSIVVHAGMANQGVKMVADRLRKRPKDLPVIVSVAVVASRAGMSDEDIASEAVETAAYIEKYHLAEAIEFNVSCPNAGDKEPFTDPVRLEKLLRVIDAHDFRSPVFLKLPNRRSWEEFSPLIETILKHDIQGVTIANLVKDRGSVELQDSLPETVRGGLSGRPTKDRSTELIRHTRQLVGDKLTIIGVGGVSSPQDAQEKLAAGADLVGVVSGLIFEGPQLITDIVHGLDEKV